MAATPHTFESWNDASQHVGRPNSSAKPHKSASVACSRRAVLGVSGARCEAGRRQKEPTVPTFCRMPCERHQDDPNAFASCRQADAGVLVHGAPTNVTLCAHEQTRPSQIRRPRALELCVGRHRARKRSRGFFGPVSAAVRHQSCRRCLTSCGRAWVTCFSPAAVSVQRLTVLKAQPRLTLLRCVGADSNTESRAEAAARGPTRCACCTSLSALWAASQVQ